MFKKIIAFLISFVFLFEQIGFAQVANVIDLSGSFSSVSSINKFRPLHLRSLVYDRIKDDFTLLLDKGDNKNVKPAQLKGSIAKLMEYFQIGVTLPNNTFWVNLRPDGKSDIIDPALENTDIGKILLEADLQLKKDMAMATSPKTREGKIYWKRLYEKAESLLGNQKINIPTLTRPWIVPGEIIVKQSADSAYVYKATLKVMLEQDHLKNSATYGFDDPRLKELNEYSSGLIREAILPKLTKKINSAKEYAPLRQVYYSIVLAQWFKKNAINMPAEYSRRINKEDLAGLSSRSAWSKDNYFNAYRKSFVDGEYNTRETVNSLNGITVRRYFSGGIMLIPDTVTEIAVIPQKTSIVPADVLAVDNKTGLPINPKDTVKNHVEQDKNDGGLENAAFTEANKKIVANNVSLLANYPGLIDRFRATKERENHWMTIYGTCDKDGEIKMISPFWRIPDSYVYEVKFYFQASKVSLEPHYNREIGNNREMIENILEATFQELDQKYTQGRTGTDGGTTDNLHKFDKLNQQLQEALKQEDGNKAGMIAQEFGALGDHRAVQILKGLLKHPGMNDGWFMRNEANAALSKLGESARLDGGASIRGMSVSKSGARIGGVVYFAAGGLFFVTGLISANPLFYFVAGVSFWASILSLFVASKAGGSDNHNRDGGAFIPKRSRTDELSSAIQEINWMRSADRDFVDRRLARIKTLIQDNKYTQNEINTALAAINTKDLDDWFFARKANTALMLGAFAIVGGLTLGALLITGPVFLPMIMGSAVTALLGIAGGYSFYKLIARDIPVRDLTSEYYSEVGKILGNSHRDGGSAQGAGILSLERKGKLLRKLGGLALLERIDDFDAAISGYTWENHLDSIQAEFESSFNNRAEFDEFKAFVKEQSSKEYPTRKLMGAGLGSGLIGIAVSMFMPLPVKILVICVSVGLSLGAIGYFLHKGALPWLDRVMGDFSLRDLKFGAPVEPGTPDGGAADNGLLRENKYDPANIFIRTFVSLWKSTVIPWQANKYIKEISDPRTMRRNKEDAARILGKLGDAKAIPYLREYLVWTVLGDNYDIYPAAEMSLKQLGLNNRDIERIYIAAFKDTGNNRLIRLNAVKVLGERTGERRTLEAFASQPEGNDILMKRAIEEASAKINQRLDKGGVSANFDGGKADELISQAKSIINGQIKNPGQAPGLFRITPEKPLVITTPDETITVTYEGLQEIKKKLSSVLKEYDVRGNDEYFTPEMLVLLGIALGTSKFDSHHGTEGLKPGDTFIIAGDNGPTTPKMRKYLALGLRAAGINVIDLDTCISGQLYTTVSRLGVQGGFYVTRSHVEVGINGFKPIIGKTTLFGDMIQVLGKQIAGDSADSGLRVMDAKDMGAFINTQELQGKITDIYKEKLNVEFTALINKLKDMDIKIAVDFGGGSATSYVDYVKGTLGSKLVNVFRAQSDPTCTKGLPDPSRDDDKCLGHPKSAGDESILSWSARNPDVVVFSFDLDTDRCGIVIAGKLYKGDILFYPVIEYALGKYGQDHKKIYYDSRMIPSIAELVDYLGGTAIIHTKGHSKEKKTVEILMTKLAKEKGFASVEDFVKATGYKNYQMEYSLHPFITIDTGACIDDAMRFMYSWLEAFTAIREKHQQPKWLLDDYLKDLRQKGAFSQWYSLSEQRTSMQEQYKKHLMNEWRDVVTKAFSGDKDFEYVNWEKFEGQKETFTLVDIEGVYYFMTPLGIFYWGWSNTSEKIAFGAHSRSREDLRVLTEVMLSMFLKLRNEKPGLNPKSIRIEAQETKALSDLFSGAGIEDIEKNAAEKFAATEDAVKYLKTAVPETRDGGSTRAALRVIVDRYKGLPPEIEMFLTDAEINAVLAGFKSKDPAVKALLARIGDRPFTKDTNDRFFARVEPQLKEDLAYIRRNAPVIRDGGEAYGFEVNKLLDQLKANDFTSQLEGAANGASYEAVKKIGNGKLSELGFELLKGEWVNRLGWTITNLKAIRDGSAGRTLEDVINDGKELKEKYKYVIFCGMGGSGLSVQFVKDTFKNEAAENIYSLRTTDPTVITLMLKEIAEKEGSLKAALDKTAIVLISKSATTPETVAHRKYFEDVYNTLGLDTQKNLWFITDTISPWGVEAQENPAMRQREIQLNGRGDVGGRFTAPGTNVFLLPMAVVAPELIVPIIDNAIEMNSIKDDPFLRLGAFMLHMAKDLNKDKLTIIVPAALKSYPMWAEQLIEESLGKFGKGITLFYDEENLDVSVLNPVDSNDRVFLRINLGIRKPQANLWKYLEDNGYPTYEISLNDLEDIGGLMLGMQRAVAAFGYLWDICFVNQPAVEGYKIASKLMDKEIISAGGNVKKVLNNIYQASSKKGVLTLYYDPLIQMGAVNINDINDQVRAFGSTMEDPAAVYAAIILLLKHKIEAGEFTSYGNMTDNLKEIFEKVRAEVFTRGLKMPAKLGVGPDKNHAYQQNIEDGKNMFFSTYFLPLQAIQPTEFGLLKDIRGFSDSMIKAQTLGTVQSMIKNKRKVVLLTSDLTAQASETEMAGFFTAVVGYLAKTDASFAEKNIRDGGSITDIAYLHNQLKDTNSANRGSAARDLAQRKDKRSVAPLIAALKTETMPNNRYAICRALVAIGTAAFTPLMFVTTDQTIKAAIREEALTALMDIAKQKKDGGSAELQELYAKAALYSPEIKPLLDILTDDTVSFEAQLKAARLLIALPAGKDFILKNKEVLYRESGVMMVLLNGPLSDGGTGIYSTQGLKNNLKNIGSYDYKKARDLAMILAKRIGRGELSAYFVGRLTVIGDVSVDGPITIGYKETPSDTITILSIPSVEQSEKSVLVNHVFPIQIKINELNNDIVVVGIDKQVVVPSGLPVSNTDGGSKMPTGERFNAWDTEGKVKRDSNDKHTGDVREYKSSPSGETNNGDNVFDGGDKTQAPLGGIDFRGMPIVSQPAIGGVRIPVMPNLTGAVALEELDKQWMEIRASMVQGPMPYLKIQEYVACCNARPDSSKQIQAVTNCVADILKAEEEDALPTCGQLKEILIQLG